MYKNISEKYGDYVTVTIADYQDLNPDGNFEERSDGIYEDGEKVAKVEIQKSANRYEIEILNMQDDTEMHDVQQALAAAGITDAGEDETGEYLVYGKLRSVFVDRSEVRMAVNVLNSLGYQTDEDEIEQEDNIEE